MNNNNKKIFLGFVLTYFTIIALVLICLFPIYTSLERAERDKAVQMIQDYGQSTMRRLESEENRLFQTARNFYMDQELKSLYYSSTHAPETTVFYNMSRLQEKLKLYFQNIDTVSGVFVYIPKFDYVLTSKYIFKSSSQFYQYNHFDSFPEKDWLNQFCSPEYNAVIKASQFTDLLNGEETYHAMNLIYTFPMAGDSNVKVLIMVSLDSQAIAEQFLLPEIREQGYAIITDKQGNILAKSDFTVDEVTGSSNSSQKYQGITLDEFAEKNVFIGVSKQFYSSIQSEVLWLIVQSIGVALLLSACVALYFAWNRSRPLEHILDIIRKTKIAKGEGSKLVDLEDTVIGMVSEIRQCKDTIKDLDSMVSHNLLERLFFGELTHGKLEDGFIQYFGSMPSPCISLVCSHENPATEGLILKSQIVNEMIAAGKDIYAIHIHRNRVYLLLQEEPNIQELITLLLKNIRESYDGIVKAGISNSITSLNLVKEGTLQAERRLEAGFPMQGIYLFAHTYSSRAARNLFNVQLLDALWRALLTGNKQTSDKIIEEIFDNVKPENLDAVELRQLFFSLRSVYSIVINQFSLDAEKSEQNISDCLHLPNDLDEYSPVSVKNAFTELNNIIYDYHQKQLAKNKRIKGFDIISYIEENFRNPNLCASSIAATFNLSEKYIFLLIKGVSGETLNDKISFLRVQEGIRLLENTDMTVSDIALNVGFTSSNSMYKVFMRVKGISPSAYRPKNK